MKTLPCLLVTLIPHVLPESTAHGVMGLWETSQFNSNLTSSSGKASILNIKSLNHGKIKNS